MNCKTCGEHLQNETDLLCNNCWEVERRLERYLNNVNAKIFVLNALLKYDNNKKEVISPIKVDTVMKRFVDIHNLANQIKSILKEAINERRSYE